MRWEKFDWRSILDNVDIVLRGGGAKHNKLKPFRGDDPSTRDIPGQC